MYKLDAASCTHPGMIRDTNEDHVWAQVYEASQDEPVGLFIVCDGMGGHLGGECASYWAVEAIRKELAVLFYPTDPRETIHLPKEELEASLKGVEITRHAVSQKIETLVVNAIQQANRVVYGYARKKPEIAADAGTTLTMAVVIGSRAVIANVGDSRTYILRDEAFQQITHDHSLVATLVATGQIAPEEIYTHPNRSMIYRSLGQAKDIQVDTFWETLKPGDSLLLCSDGLWEMLRDDGKMAALLHGSTMLEQACNGLIDAANQAGGEDNIGVVLARLS
jgi:protein phosphatase